MDTFRGLRVPTHISSYSGFSANEKKKITKTITIAIIVIIIIKINMITRLFKCRFLSWNHLKYITLKESVGVILSDLPSKDDDAQFTTVSLKAFV